MWHNAFEIMAYSYVCFVGQFKSVLGSIAVRMYCTTVSCAIYIYMYMYNVGVSVRSFHSNMPTSMQNQPLVVCNWSDIV